MNKEEREFLEKLQRDIDYRFQKIKEQNFDLQNKILELRRIILMKNRNIVILLSVLDFKEKVKDWFRRRIRYDQRSFKM